MGFNSGFKGLKNVGRENNICIHPHYMCLLARYTGSLENIPPLSLENKLLIYKTVLKPEWTYGIELWGCATKSNIAVIQRYQSILLRTITNAPWYVSNQTLHSNLHCTILSATPKNFNGSSRSKRAIYEAVVLFNYCTP